MNFEVGKEQGHFLINCHQDLNNSHSDEAIEVIRSCFDELIMSDELQGIVIIRGKDLAVKSTTSSTTLVLPFESVEGAFHIEIGVD
jgi:hypothetical protein